MGDHYLCQGGQITIKNWLTFLQTPYNYGLKKKKSGFSSAPSSNFYKNNNKKSHAPRQILSLGKTREMHAFFWYGIFACPCHYCFFSDENQDIYFQFQKIKINKLPALVIFFLMRIKTFTVHGLCIFEPPSNGNMSLWSPPHIIKTAWPLPVALTC